MNSLEQPCMIVSACGMCMSDRDSRVSDESALLNALFQPKVGRVSGSRDRFTV